MKLILSFLDFYEVLLASKAFIHLREAGKSTQQFIASLNHDIALEFNRYKELNLMFCVRCLVKDKIKEIMHNLSNEMYLKSTLDAFQFILFSFADEFFIYLKWEFADEWCLAPLELEEYKTKIAGQRVFDQLNEFLENHSKVEKELGPIFVFILCLGFCGMYKSSEDKEERISVLKTTLVKSFAADYDISEQIGVLEQQPYSNTIQKELKAQFDYSHFYKRLAIGCVVVIIVLHFVAFMDATKSYYSIINKLI